VEEKEMFGLKIRSKSITSKSLNYTRQKIQRSRLYSRESSNGQDSNTGPSSSSSDSKPFPPEEELPEN
jgi:hypothetical protein